MKILTSLCALGVGLGLAAAGCGTDSASGVETLPNLTVPPVPDNGLQVILPIVRGIAAGTDVEMCTWTDAVVDHDVDVRSTLSFQTEPGHHVVVYYTTVKVAPGTQRVCNDTDMATFRFVAGSATEGEPNEAPGNLVFRIPKGGQIVINHHYLNATDNMLDGQSVVNLNYADPGGTYIPSGSTAFLNSTLNIDPGIHGIDISCTMDRALKLWYVAPHMHEWGKNISIKLTKAGTKSTLFDTMWDPSFTFHPPEIRKDPAAPMMLDVGDKIDVHCDWNNTSGHVLNFGFEMCVGFGQFVDEAGLGNWACDDGSWGDF